VPLDPQSVSLLEMMAASGQPPLHECTPEEARGGVTAMTGVIGPGPDVAAVRDVAIPVEGGEIPARVYDPVAEPEGTVVYLHGGGWVVGGLDEWDAACRHLAVASGARVVSVGYRLAPEHRFPVAVDDSWAALEWAAEHLHERGGLAVAGDSAGGNLAAVCAIRARDRGGPELALQVLVYPVTDAAMASGSYDEHGEGYFLGRADMEWFWGHYAPDPADRAHPEASPLRAEDLAGLPPAHLVIAEFDPLRDEGLAYAERLEAAGVPVTVVHHDDQMHAFFTLVNMLSAGDRAMVDVGQAIRAGIGSPS
jgi:acetyl esterase